MLYAGEPPRSAHLHGRSGIDTNTAMSTLGQNGHSAPFRRAPTLLLKRTSWLLGSTSGRGENPAKAARQTKLGYYDSSKDRSTL